MIGEAIQNNPAFLTLRKIEVDLAALSLVRFTVKPKDRSGVLGWP